MNNKSKIAITCIALITTTVIAPTALAGNHNKGSVETKESTKPTVSASPSTTTYANTVSTWISPFVDSVKSMESLQNMIKVNPGSAIPLRFKLFNSAVELKSIKNVVVTASTASCLGASPNVTASNIKNVTPGKSLKSSTFSSTLKYNQDGFRIVWKSAKNSTGCFQFRVTYPNGVLDSPIFSFSKL